MTEPNTSNIGLIVPNTGDLVGTWGLAALNPDFVAIDGLFGGVVTVSVASSPVTLTSPSGATISASAGPTQSQNSVIQFTGVLSAGVTVTLPLPGIQTIANFTTGNFVLSFRAVASGAVVATPQGTVMRIYNDGTDVHLLGDVSTWPGKMEFHGGISTVPAWINACTVKPYLLADGSVYNYSDFPYLAAIYQGQFGGNGITTFAVEDMQGRVPLAYDGTGTRITTAGCGINGQTIGAAGGSQGATLTQANLPAATTLTTTIAAGQGSHVHTALVNSNSSISNSFGGTGASPQGLATTDAATLPAMIGTTALGGSGTSHFNVQPALVSGIWLIKT